MSSLSSCLSLTKNIAHASLPNNNNGSSSSSSSSPSPSPSPPQSLPSNINTTKLPMRSRTTPPLTGKKQPNSQRRKPNQPSVIEIERAIGAGRFRDSENSDVEAEEKDANFDMSMMNFGKFEGPVEKQLRETGEWVTNETERGFRSNGKNILGFMVLWVLPIWAFSLLVAVGAIKLNIPFLNDLIM